MEPGDHLDQKTFHARYEAMPEDVRAELIGGVVYMPSPLKLHHGRIHARLIHWLGTYKEATPGVEVAELNEDTTQLLVVLRKGLDTPEHAAFVARLT